jgi:hypothetical protein
VQICRRVVVRYCVKVELDRSMLAQFDCTRCFFTGEPYKVHEVMLVYLVSISASLTRGGFEERMSGGRLY